MAHHTTFAVLCCGLVLAGCSLLPGTATEPQSDAVDDASVSDITPPDDAAPGALFGFLGRMVGSPAATAIEEAPTDSVLPVVPEDAPQPRPGLFAWMGFGGGDPASAAPTSSASTSQGDLPYGELRVVCGLSGRNLGREVESASGYAVHDTAPGSTQPRTHYITGFNDGCARQFTAALALFGDIGTHEIVRYGMADGGLDYTETDHAYEEIKAAFCGVRAGRPCGARLDRLARRTTFLTVYERFGSSPVWADILLHNGTVAAMDFKGD